MLSSRLLFGPIAVVCSNHVSYLDMAVHLHRTFSPFVARGDVVGAPFVGVFRCSLWQHKPCVPCKLCETRVGLFSGAHTCQQKSCVPCKPCEARVFLLTGHIICICQQDLGVLLLKCMCGGAAIFFSASMSQTRTTAPAVRADWCDPLGTP